MHKLIVLVIIVVFYVVLNIISRCLTGINPTGWRLYVYDTPALLTGVLAGYFLL